MENVFNLFMLSEHLTKSHLNEEHPFDPKSLSKRVVEEKKTTSKWTTSLDVQFRPDFDGGHSATLDEIDWELIKGLMRSDKGSEGLFFAELKEPEKAIFIMKRSVTLGQEILASLLCLRFGLASPRFRVVNMGSDEGVAVDAMLADRVIDPAGHGQSTFARAKQILLLEFIQGKSLREIDHVDAATIFGKDGLTDAGRERVAQLGGLLALDVLCNNSDRFPLVWMNEGNLGNIMISRSVMSIDTKVVPIPDKEPKLYPEYMKKVQKVLIDLARNPTQEQTAFRNVRDALIAETDYDIGEEGSVALQEGFFRVATQIAEFDVDAELPAWIKFFEEEDVELNPDNTAWLKNMVRLFKDPTSVVIEAPVVPKATPTASTSEDKPRTTFEYKKEEVQGPTELSWSKIVVSGHKPRPLRYATSTLYGGQYYILGGQTAQGPVNDLYKLTRGIEEEEKPWEWEVLPTPPIDARFGHSATLVGSKWYIFGGTTDGKSSMLGDMWCYDFKTGEWASLNPEGAPSPRAFHVAVTMGENILLFGGQLSLKKHSDETWQYSIASNTWTKLDCGVSPQDRAAPLSFIHKEKWYIFGGFSGDGGYDQLLDLAVYDPVANSWETDLNFDGAMPMTGRQVNAAYVDGEVWVYGGYSAQLKKPQRALLRFNVDTRKWIKVDLWLALDMSDMSAIAKGSQGTEPIPRYGHGFVHDPEWESFVVIGGSGSMYLDDVFEIDLEDDE